MLDLSEFQFSHTSVSLDQVDSTTVTASGFGEASQGDDIQYYDPTTGQWSTDMPTEVGNYRIGVPISFVETKYRVPESGEDGYPSGGTTI